MKEVINRQAAIDVLHVCLPGIPLKRLNEILSAVPAAQPEIIRCKYCKHRIINENYGKKRLLDGD